MERGERQESRERTLRGYEDTLTTLGGRLARLERELDESGRKQVCEITGGPSLGEMSATLLKAIDPDAHRRTCIGKPGAAPQEVEPAACEQAKQQRALYSKIPFNLVHLSRTGWSPQ